MAKKKRISKLDRIRKKNAEKFIGRKEPIDKFKKHLQAQPGEEDFIDFFNIYGQGGLGKTFLSKKLRDIASKNNSITTYTEEDIKTPLAFMASISNQLLSNHKINLKQFSERYDKFQQLTEKAEQDEKAPKGWISSVSEVAIEASLNMAETTPMVGGLAKMIDKEKTAKLVGSAMEYFSKTWKNKDEVKLLLNPINVLTPLFLDDLWEELVDKKEKVIFILDTYEETSLLLDPWLRAVLNNKHGEFPDFISFIIAGRKELDRNDWSAFHDSIKRFSLSPFTEEEAREFLKNKGIEKENLVRNIIQLSLKLPIYLSMLAAEAPDSEEIEGDFTSSLVDRFLQWIKEKDQRDLALYASMARSINQDIVKCLIKENLDAQKMFDWLRSRPFVMKRGDVWAYHPEVSTLMLQYIYERSQEDWERYHLQLAALYESRLKRLEIQEKKEAFIDEEWQSFNLEKHYHLLSANQRKHFPAFIRDLVSLLRFAPKSAAIPYADTIMKINLSGNLQKWKEIISSGISAYISNDEKASKLFSEIKTLEFIQDEEDLKFLLLEEIYLFLDNSPQKADQYLSDFIEKFPNVAIGYFLKGVINDETERFDLAIEHYEKAIAIQPDDASAYNNLGVVYYKMESYELAIQHYEKAIVIQPDHSSAYYNLGIVYDEMKSYELAIEHYEKAIAIQPDYAGAYYNLGNAYDEIMNYDLAIENYKKAIAIQPDDADAYNNLGSVYSKMESYDQAIEHYEKAIEIQPDYGGAYYNLGIVYDEMKSYELAIEHYEKAIEIQPDYANAYYNLGNTYNKMESYVQAIEHYEKALVIQPDHSSAYYNLGIVYDEMKSYELAIEHYEKAIEIQPDYDGAYYNLGNTYYKMESYELAIEHYEKALDIQPDYASAYNNLGNAYDEIMNYDLAIENYKKAIAIKPDNASAYNNLGYTYYKMESYELAIEHYEKAIEIQPDYDGAHYNLGNTYSKMESYELAIEHYEKAIDIQPDYASAYYNLGNTYYKMESYELAIEHYEKALDIQPDYAEYHHSLGWVYLLQHQLSAAEKALAYSFELSNFTDSYAPMNLGHVRLFQGQDAEALELYQKSLSLWEDAHSFFEAMEEDYQILKMATFGIPKEKYDEILRQLKVIEK